MYRVVIVGGGFGGVRVARELVKRTRGAVCDIVVIDERDAHVYTPLLYVVATTLPEVHSAQHAARVERRTHIAFADFPRNAQVRFVHTRVTGVAHDGSHVVCANGAAFRADAIVLAVGSLTNDFGISGVAEYAHTLKSFDDAKNVQKRFHDLLEEIACGVRQRATVAVVGAGANGVEVIAEMAEVASRFFTRIEKKSPMRFVLCDSKAEPVGMFPLRVRRAVARRLRQLGVEFLPNTAVRAVTAHNVQTSVGDIPFDLLLWSAGVKSRPEPHATWKFPANERGRLCVANTFLVQGTRNVFALGDIAARIDGADPQSAQTASLQATTVARNILAFFDKKRLSHFSPPSWQTLLVVGGEYGVGEVFGVPLCGWFAFLLRRGVDLKYFFSVFPFVFTLRVWYRTKKHYGESSCSST